MIATARIPMSRPALAGIRFACTLDVLILAVRPWTVAAEDLSRWAYVIIGRCYQGQARGSPSLDVCPSVADTSRVRRLRRCLRPRLKCWPGGPTKSPVGQVRFHTREFVRTRDVCLPTRTGGLGGAGGGVAVGDPALDDPHPTLCGTVDISAM